MPKSEFQHYLCRPFCHFYKPGTEEAFHCRGAWLVERLIQFQRLTPGDFQGLRRDESFSPGGEADLETLVCEGCLFRIEDCDFKALHPPKGSRPCGGLLLLKELLSKGKIALRDLSMVKD